MYVYVCVCKIVKPNLLAHLGRVLALEDVDGDLGGQEHVAQLVILLLQGRSLVLIRLAKITRIYREGEYSQKINFLTPQPIF